MRTGASVGVGEKGEKQLGPALGSEGNKLRKETVQLMVYVRIAC